MRKRTGRKVGKVDRKKKELAYPVACQPTARRCPKAKRGPHSTTRNNKKKCIKKREKTVGESERAKALLHLAETTKEQTKIVVSRLTLRILGTKVQR